MSRNSYGPGVGPEHMVQRPVSGLCVFDYNDGTQMRYGGQYVGL